MASTLETYLNHIVSVITSDGRNFVGTLKGFDQTINVVLEETHERVYNPNQGVEQVPLGLQLLRGDNIVLIGEIDEDLDGRLEFAALRGEQLPSLVH
ncbi:U6 snRNA-associated Sm-like protein LSm8 isoform X2 [Artemia franciscana]|uniref:U6 snRNA-associated Sm-like protein LSm8 n=1 Tax=Artemia franciscana TaxID=6661 RepID=A0AA88L8X8_ARTSF|nr:hypothetical protein QYM36_003112 [Artemia franciscana]